MIKFACLAPHPPLLIPNIGKENLEIVSATSKTLNKLEVEFYQLKPETILIISPHGELIAEAFTINQAAKLMVEFSQFGDLETKLEYNNDVDLGYKIREYLETKMPVRLISDPQLDHGAGVPLFYLTSHLKEVKIIPIGYSLLSLAEHYQFGKYLQEMLAESTKNIGIIASGDLSHCLTPDAPAGYSPRGQEFDHLFIKLLKEKNIKKILNLDKKLIEEAAECGLRSFIILLGILDGINYEVEILSYEGPFGVGYLVANFKL